MDTNKHSITIDIVGKKHVFKQISPEEESFMRKAASMINSKVEEYMSKYEKISSHDALCITSLIYVTQLLKDRRKNSNNEFEKKLEDLNSNLEEYINNIVSR